MAFLTRQEALTCDKLKANPKGVGMHMPDPVLSLSLSLMGGWATDRF